MSLNINYENLEIKWNIWTDVPMFLDLINEMKRNKFDLWKHNWGEYLKKYYNLNINVQHVMYLDNIGDRSLYFTSVSEMNLFIMNFL